jgi:D-serine deaminase-like pyridoxal phosphate-dependent protein
MTIKTITIDAVKGSSVQELDTPALLIDLDKLEQNIKRMQAYTVSRNLSHRPHIKTHKTPEIAKMQIQAGATGITVAKLGEAEVMAAHGIKDIFVANELVGAVKMRRLVALARDVRLSVGVENVKHVELLAEAFENEAKALEVLIEVEIGDERTGVKPENVQAFAEFIQTKKGVKLKGLFTHEGHDYGASSKEQLVAIAKDSRRVMVDIARGLERALGLAGLEVSVGSTPALLADLVFGHDLTQEGVTELRTGTPIFFDAHQSNIIGHTEWCAASVMAVVMSTPTPDRAVIDAGAKTLAIDKAAGNLREAQSFGKLVGHDGYAVTRLNDEHGVITGTGAGEHFQIGDLVRVIPNHVCPCVNLHEVAYGIRNDKVEVVWQVAARGKLQ